MFESFCLESSETYAEKKFVEKNVYDDIFFNKFYFTSLSPCLLTSLNALQNKTKTNNNKK